MRKSATLILLSLLLPACSSLQIPVNLDPGQYREGRQSVVLDYAVRSFDLRLPVVPLVFDPPSPKLTYASLDAALEVTVETSPAVQGRASALLYLAPAGAGGTCDQANTYREAYAFVGTTVPLGAPAPVSFQGTLNPDQLAGLNAGRLCLGVAVALWGEDYFQGLSVAWRFTRLRAGVGIL